MTADLWSCVIGVDPSESSSGWCVLGAKRGSSEWLYVGSGQCRGELVVEKVFEQLSADGVFWDVKILAVEGMFHGAPREKMMMPPHYWRLGFRTGLIAGEMMGSRPAFSECTELWIPKPNEWRDAIGIKRGRRDAIACRMLKWSQAATGQAMEGPRGGKQADRAMAVGIAYAASQRVSW